MKNHSFQSVKSRYLLSVTSIVLATLVIVPSLSSAQAAFVGASFNSENLGETSMNNSRYANPENFCAELGNSCTEAMKQITADYSRSKDSFATQRRMPIAYSGQCFYANNNLDPEHIHHGLAVFVESEGVPSYMGEFGFFYPSDPWEGKNSMDLLRMLKDKGQSATKMKRERNSRVAEFTTKSTEVQYWIRSSSADTRIYLIGRQHTGPGALSYVFCEMRRH